MAKGKLHLGKHLMISSPWYQHFLNCLGSINCRTHQNASYIGFSVNLGFCNVQTREIPFFDTEMWVGSSKRMSGLWCVGKTLGFHILTTLQERELRFHLYLGKLLKFMYTLADLQTDKTTTKICNQDQVPWWQWWN